MAWVIDHFKSLVYKGKYHLGNYFHKECAWYVYSIYLEQELDTVEIEQNKPHIRKSKSSKIFGIPDKLFSTPQLHGHVNCFEEISLEEIDTLLQEYENRNRKNIFSDAKEILNDHDPTLVEYFDYFILEKQLDHSSHDWEEAKIMFQTINRLLRTLTCRECSCESSHSCAGTETTFLVNVFHFLLVKVYVIKKRLFSRIKQAERSLRDYVNQNVKYL